MTLHLASGRQIYNCKNFDKKLKYELALNSYFVYCFCKSYFGFYRSHIREDLCCWEDLESNDYDVSSTGLCVQMLQNYMKGYTYQIFK